MNFKNIIFYLIFSNNVVSVNIFRREKDVFFDRKLVGIHSNRNKFGIYNKSFLPKKKVSINSTKQFKPLKENYNQMYLKIDGKRRLISSQNPKKVIQQDQQRSLEKKNILQKKYDIKILKIKKLLEEDNKMLSSMKNNMITNHNRKLAKKASSKKDTAESGAVEGEVEEGEEAEEEVVENKEVDEKGELNQNDKQIKITDTRIPQEPLKNDLPSLPKKKTNDKESEAPINSIQSKSEYPFKDINETNQENPILIINQPVHHTVNHTIHINNGQNQLIQNQQHINNNQSQILNENGTPVVNEAKEVHEPVYYDQFGAVISNEENPQTKIVNGNQVIFAHQLAKHPLVRYNYNNNGILEEKNDVVTFQEIDTLVDLLNSINGIYQQYFLIMPKENELVDIKANSAENEKSTIDKTLEVLNFYKKMRTFVKTIVFNRKQLLDDIHFLQSRTDKLKATEDDMLEFYDLEHQYFRAKMGSALYEEKDPKFSTYFMSIHDLTLSFETDLKKVVKEVYNLSKFNNFFQAVITELGTSSQTVNILSILVTIDKVLMLLLRLYEFKSEIKLTIKTTQEALTNLKYYRMQIETVLNQVNKLTEYYRIDLKKIDDAKKEGTGIFYTFFVAIGTFILLI